MTGRRRPWSCDSFVALPKATGDKAMLFGKNSDRPVRECQPLRRVPARQGGGPLRLGYVTIPDVERTYAHVGSSPYWCWGHEMGLNEHGVVIGNEALFTRPWAENVRRDRSAVEHGTDRPEPGLIGMELLRLGLERGANAAQAVTVITDLLERHGQWAAGTVGSERAEATYDNSFLVADPDRAFIVETAGREWAVREVTEPTAAISNQPTIRGDASATSKGLGERIRGEGWPQSGDVLDFAEAVVDPGTPLQLSHIRLQRSRSLLHEAGAAGRLDWSGAHRVLSDHYEDTFLAGPNFNAARPDFLTLCMHAHTSGFTWGNTAASVIARPGAAQPHWWWAPVTPCTSLYLPVAVSGEALPDQLSAAGTAGGSGPSPEGAMVDAPAEGSYWWVFQSLLEAVCGDENATKYAERQPRVREVFDGLQGEFIEQVAELEAAGHGTREWDRVTAECTERAQAAAQSLLEEFRAA